MNNCSFASKAVVAGFGLLAFVSAPMAEAQSFVGLKGGKKMMVKRLLPPAVNLTRKRIAVSSEPLGGVTPDVANVLKTRVVTAIQRDPNFVIDEAAPETRLSFKVTTFRVEPVQMTVGNPPKPCTVFVGRADVSYQAIEVATGIPQDSENLGWSIETDKPPQPLASAASSGISKVGDKISFWKQPPSCGTHAKLSQSAATDELYEELVQQVTQRAAPVDEDVEVGLPGGKLKDLSALAMDKRWSVLLEQAEQMPKLDKPEDDASRLYLIALAHEALAYDSRREAFELERRRVSGVSGDASRDAQERENKFFQTSKSHLEQAAQFYRDAIAGDRDEKEFRRPEARIEYAVRLYATIERQKSEYAASRKKIVEDEQRSRTAETAKLKAEAAKPKADVAAGTAIATPRAVDAELSSGPNAEIMKLCAEKLDEATVIDFIQSSTAQFDLSAPGLIALRRSCGESTGKYAAAMRLKVSPKKPKPASTKPKAPATPVSAAAK